MTDHNLACIYQTVDDSVDLGIGNSNLKVFGGELVGHVDGSVEIVDEDASTVRPERGAACCGAYLGQGGELAFEFGVGGVSERG